MRYGIVEFLLKIAVAGMRYAIDSGNISYNLILNMLSIRSMATSWNTRRLQSIRQA